jgi:molybdate transport system permease protein
MVLSVADSASLLLSFRLAAITTALLFVAGAPLAWWLAKSKSRLTGIVGACVALPIVLPPTVIGFYMLMAMGPHGPIGRLTRFFGFDNLPFTFTGLIVASFFYSLPFMVQPLQAAFESLGNKPLEAAATLRASPLDIFISVVIPMCAPGFLTAGILTFAHTVGEFGVVLMIGGSLPGITRVASVQIYGYVEAMQYGNAHRLAATMLVFCFAVLLPLYIWRARKGKT